MHWLGVICWTGAISLPVTIINVIILVIIGVFIIIKRRESDPVIWQCAWCGKQITTARIAVKDSIKYGYKLYCCGRCQRADEASDGVKEKRIRWIDHE